MFTLRPVGLLGIGRDGQILVDAGQYGHRQSDIKANDYSLPFRALDRIFQGKYILEWLTVLTDYISLSSEDQTKLETNGIGKLKWETCDLYGTNTVATDLAALTKLTTIAKDMGIDKFHLSIKTPFYFSQKTPFQDLRNNGGKLMTYGALFKPYKHIM